MSNKDLREYYNREFYDCYASGSIYSAKVILGLLYNFYKPQSVIDFGCGVGSWLKVAESLGSTVLKGLDGHWITKNKLLSKNIDFTAVNMEQNLQINNKYDLCICLEVAEHLSESRAKPFIDTLCKASNVVLFSAAIKYQRGTNHINEQWQTYWINLFQSNNYTCYDVFRSAIWENDEVELWYRQNIFLFVNEKGVKKKINLKKLKSLEKPILNIVHPKNYENKSQNILDLNRRIQEPSLRFCIGCMKRYLFGLLIKAGKLVNKNQNRLMDINFKHKKAPHLPE